VVHVPVDDGHARETARLARVFHRDRHVREHAESHAEVGLRVVAGRAHERVGVAHAAVEHGVRGRERAARGEQRDLEAARAEGRERAGVAAALGGELPQALEVGARVDAQHFVFARRARCDALQLLQQPRHFEQALEAPLALRALDVAIRLDHAAGGHEARRGARVVPEVTLVEDEAGARHAARASGP
jgi:hypothetical protein